MEMKRLIMKMKLIDQVEIHSLNHRCLTHCKVSCMMLDWRKLVEDCNVCENLASRLSNLLSPIRSFKAMMQIYCVYKFLLTTSIDIISTSILIDGGASTLLNSCTFRVGKVLAKRGVSGALQGFAHRVYHASSSTRETVKGTLLSS